MGSFSEFSAVIAITIAVMLAGEAAARDLRPSYHGLLFQNSPPSPANSSPGMRSFFHSSPASTSSDVSLPKATNSTESLPPSWWKTSSGGDGGGGGRGHFGGALMVASLVCGVTGVVLLVASGLLYLFRHRLGKPQLNESFRDIDSNVNANKLQLVPVVSNP